MLKQRKLILLSLVSLFGLYACNKSDSGCDRIFIQAGDDNFFPTSDRIYYVNQDDDGFRIGYKFLDKSLGSNAEITIPGFYPTFIGSNDNLYLAYRKERKSIDTSVLVKVDGMDITHVLDLGKSWVAAIGSFRGADLIVTNERISESGKIDKTKLYTSTDNWQTHVSEEIELPMGRSVVAGNKLHVFKPNVATRTTKVHSYNLATKELDYVTSGYHLIPVSSLEGSDDLIAGHRYNRESFQFKRYIGGHVNDARLVAEIDLGRMFKVHWYRDLVAYSYLYGHDSDAIGEELKLVLSKNGGQTWGSLRELSDYHDVSFYKDQYFTWRSSLWKLQVCEF